MKKSLTVWVIALLLMMMSVCGALGAQDVQIPGANVVISFPDTFLVISSEMDESLLEGSGIRKEDLIAELEADGLLAQAMNAAGSIRFDVMKPYRGSLDLMGASDAEKSMAELQYYSDYAKAGCEVEEYGVMDTPYASTLRIKFHVPDTDRYYLHYYYADGRQQFSVSAATDGAPFTREDMALCDAIVKSIHPVNCDDAVISVERFTEERTQMSFAVPVLWHHTETVKEGNMSKEVFEPYGAEGCVDITYDSEDVYALVKEAGKGVFSRGETVEKAFGMTRAEFDCFSVQTMTKAYADPDTAEIYMISRGGREYAVSQFTIEFMDGGRTYAFPRLIVQHTDMDAAISHRWIYTEWEPLEGSGMMSEFSRMLETVEYPIVTDEYKPASSVVRRVDNAYDFDENGVSEIWGGEMSGLIAKDGRILAELEWERVDSAGEGFYEIHAKYQRENYKGCRYVRADGTVLGDETWFGVSDFSEGLAAVEFDLPDGIATGYINHDGEVVIEAQYYDAGVFSEGLAAVWKEKDEFSGYINQKGETVIEPAWDYGYDFREGLACVFNGKVNGVLGPGKGVYGVIDQTGRLVGEMIWEDELVFSDGMAAVKKDGKYGYMDAAGNVVVQPQWSGAEPFSGGLAAVQDESGRYAFINKTGALVTDYAWDYVEPFDGNGLARVFTGALSVSGRPSRGQYGMINQQGETVIDAAWDNAFVFSEGYAAVRQGGLFGLIDGQGKIVLQPQWEDLSPLSEGMLAACKDGKYGYINLQGNTVLAFEWDEAYAFSNGLARVKKDGCWYYIDRTGKVVI